MAKMKMTSRGANRCMLEYDRYGTRVSREFEVAAEGGHVYDLDQFGRSFQMHKQLASTGPLLMWYPGDGNLADMIRREYRAKRRAESRLAR